MNLSDKNIDIELEVYSRHPPAGQIQEVCLPWSYMASTAARTLATVTRNNGKEIRSMVCRPWLWNANKAVQGRHDNLQTGRGNISQFLDLWGLKSPNEKQNLQTEEKITNKNNNQTKESYVNETVSKTDVLQFAR